MKLYIVLLIACLVMGCASDADDSSDEDDKNLTSNDNDIKEDDMFNSHINFKELDFNIERSYSTNEIKYDTTNTRVFFIVDKAMEKLDDDSKNRLIDDARYKDIFAVNVDHVFIDNSSFLTMVIGHINSDPNSLNEVIDSTREFRNISEYSEEYYSLNNFKNIQFKFLLNNSYLLRVIFEESNNSYLIIDYTFPSDKVVINLEKISKILDSIKFF